MKLQYVIAATLLLFNFFMIDEPAQAQVSEQAAHNWLNSKEWGDGISLLVAPSVNAVEFYKQYHNNKAVWQKVFRFLKTQNPDTLSVGKYPIDGDNAFATITDGPSKELEQTKWESHRNYIDLQCVIKGKEKIGVAPVSQATIVTPYNAEHDAANYTADGIYYIASPGNFFLFFQQDAHRPGIKVDGYDQVKKLVIKIKVAQ